MAALTEADLIRLNIGGSSFILTKKLLTSNPQQESLLSDFCNCSHEERLPLCCGYLPRTEEYFFARSPTLFEPIYRFYATCHLHRPRTVCPTEFLAELAFWKLEPALLERCCKKEVQQEDAKSNGICIEPKVVSTRERMWLFCEGDGSRASTYFQFISLTFIFVSITCLILGTMDTFRVPIEVPEKFKNETKLPRSMISTPNPALVYIEYVCIAFFSLEYLVRLILSPSKLAFLRAPLNVVDLIAIAPFYLEIIFEYAGAESGDLSAAVVLRVLRVLRVARVLRLGRHSQAMQVFMNAMALAGKQLAACLGLFLIMMVFFSTVVYFMEESSADTPITSIPVGFWWCVVTMTTVGYGDIVPVTLFGKLAASVGILGGVLVLALPITVIVNNFGTTPTEVKSGNEDEDDSIRV